jgi:hypothetical protein
LPVVVPIALVASAFAFRRVELARAVFYLTACRVNGTPPEEADSAEIVVAARTRAAWRLPRATAFVAWSVVAAVLLWYGQLALVPPTGETVKIAPAAVIEPVPDDQNSWVLYREALAQTPKIDGYGLDVTVPEALQAYGSGETDAISAEQLALVDYSIGALNSMNAGAHRPMSQYTTEPVSIRTRLPNYIEARTLAGIALTRARQLAESGRMDEATALMVVTLRYGADLSEPRGSSLGAFVSSSVLRSCRRLVSTWHEHGRLSPQRATALARALADVNRRVPTAAEVETAEWRNFVSFTHEEIFTAKDNGSWLLDFLPGLRARMWNAFADEANAFHATAQEALARDDVAAWESAVEASDEPSVGWALVNPPDALGRLVFHQLLVLDPQPGLVYQTLVRDRAENAALEARLAGSERH